MAINKIELQDTEGNILYPHTSSDNVDYDSNKTVSEKIDEAIANLTTLKAGLVTAVNDKNDDSNLSSNSSLADITSKINAIVTLSSGTNDATATASQILSGSTAYSKGSKVTGTMANKGAIIQALNAGESYTIPAGYHNGSGKVTVNTLASQTSATATVANILSGQTAYVNGNKITGTMPNKGSYTDVTSWTPYNSKMFFRFPAGYYSGGSYANDTQGGAECAIPMATITRDLGITGDKIVSGNTILGVAGTATIQSLGGVVHATDNSFVYCSPTIQLDVDSNDNRSNTTIIDIPFEPSVVIGRSKSEPSAGSTGQYVHTYYGSANEYNINSGNGFFLYTKDSSYGINKQLTSDSRTQIDSVTYANGKLTVTSYGTYGGTNLRYIFMIVAYK